MKKIFLVSILTVFILACQSTEETPEYDISKLGFDKEVANTKLSHEPTGVVYEETENQSVKIDFSLGKSFEFCIVTCDRIVITDSIYSGFYNRLDNMSSLKGVNYIYFDGNLYDIPTFGKLVEFYKRHPFRVSKQYRNLGPFYPSEIDGNLVFSKLHYALAQECFQDNCSSQTRKAVLRMALERGIATVRDVDAYHGKKSAIFLMAVILIKEKDTDFIAALYDHPDLQKSICLEVDSWGSVYWIDELCGLVSQFAINFLSNQ